MEITYYGANCVRITNKKVSIVIDDNLEDVGLKSVTQADDIAVFTQHEHKPTGAKFTIDNPGEYEISEVSVQGIAAQKHVDSDGKNAIIYSLIIGDLTFGVLGHINPSLTDEQLEALGLIDVLFVPIGGNGFTIDSTGAVQVIKKIEPKLVVPTHFADSKISYEVPQAELDKFLHEVGAADTKPVDNLKLKKADLQDKTEVIVLNRQ